MPCRSSEIWLRCDRIQLPNDLRGVTFVQRLETAIGASPVVAHANSQAHTWTKLTGAGIDKIEVDPVLREEMVTATRVHVGVCTGCRRTRLSPRCGEVCSINAEMIGGSRMIRNYIGGQVSVPRGAIPPLRRKLRPVWCSRLRNPRPSGSDRPVPCIEPRTIRNSREFASSIGQIEPVADRNSGSAPTASLPARIATCSAAWNASHQARHLSSFAAARHSPTHVGIAVATSRDRRHP
jgi:hypothetical protein